MNSNNDTKTDMNVSSETQDIDVSKKYFNDRVESLKNIDKYPHKFQISIEIPEFLTKYDSLIKEQVAEEKMHSIAGRIVTLRLSSKKLFFFHINSYGKSVQIMVNARFYNQSPKYDLPTLMKFLSRSDIVGIQGYPTRTKTGELSLLAYEVTLLAPCYWDIPPSLTDRAIRCQKRHLDLLVNPSNRQIFITRNRIIQYIRNFLTNLDFVELDTPMMHPIAGGAAAKPFITHHNCLDRDLFMRIAPELYLKKAIIGGFDRVFEIGKQFRNESIDMTHNPEFTTCEFYWSYADYNDLITVTENMISGMVKNICGSMVIEYNGKSIDFTPPFQKISMIPALESHMKVKFPDCSYDSPEMIDFLLEECRKYNIFANQTNTVETQLDLTSSQTTNASQTTSVSAGTGMSLSESATSNKLKTETKPPTVARMLDKLVGAFIEPTCVNPTFICDHPLIMSPLAKVHRNNPHLTERFELFIDGMEYCNSYTELNDPFDQRERFMKQITAKNAGDDEAQDLDEDFCQALEYGLPPTGGWGCGIERLTMLMTNSPNIKEVILFPA